ncbi:IS3 family transposase [Bacillus sp. JCM 19034]|uniref:IS3 family transposase n=1 Tax=Bacillus sp. JCM 19034 TaxID=1481928 RepID=UPI0009E80807
MITQWQKRHLRFWKTELINGEYFHSLNYLELELFDYINWYNNIRSHSALGYKVR